jgi:hypothetical protein
LENDNDDELSVFSENVKPKRTKKGGDQMGKNIKGKTKKRN